MCLILTVRLAEADAVRALEICRAAGLPTWSENWLFSFRRWPPGVVHLPGPYGDCGCGFLAPGWSLNAPTWNMVPSTLPRLAATLRAMRQETSSGFSFEALWANEPSTEEQRVTIDELAHLIEQSKLGAKTRYIVE